MKKNPAVKSMATLMLYLVLIILIWYGIGMVAFPTQSREDRLKSYVKQNEPLLVQIAENAMDETVWEGILTTPEVLEVLDREEIADVQPYAQGAAFVIEEDGQDPHLQRLLIYLPDGQYALTLEGDWQPATAGSDGTLRWEGGDGPDSYVTATKLSDHFFLQEAYRPS